MGLLSETLTDSFVLWKKHFLKLFLYQLLFLSLFSAAVALVVAGVFFGISSIGLTINAGLAAVSVVLFVVGIVMAVVISAAQVGGYALIVKRASERENIAILDIFRESLGKTARILAALFLQSLPFIVIALIATIMMAFLAYMFVSSLLRLGSLPIGGLSFLPISGMQVLPPGINGTPLGTPLVPDVSGSMLVAMLLFLLIPIAIIIPIGIAALYISLRLFLSVPIVMIEGLGAIESLRKSWQMTSGKFWSIFATVFLIGIIVGIITAAVSFVLELAFSPIDVLLPAGYNISIGSTVGNLVNYLVFSTISAVVPTIYYYNSKSERKRSEKF